jgi:DnaJ-class molecular chaperone
VAFIFLEQDLPGKACGQYGHQAVRRGTNGYFEGWERYCRVCAGQEKTIQTEYSRICVEKNVKKLVIKGLFSGIELG